MTPCYIIYHPHFNGRYLRLPGPNFCWGDEYWHGGSIPCLSLFINGRSFIIFEVLGLNQNDLLFLEASVDDWPKYRVFRMLHHAITKLNVVNDPAERRVTQTLGMPSKKR